VEQKQNRSETEMKQKRTTNEKDVTRFETELKQSEKEMKIR
jgi:hypothetical protein